MKKRADILAASNHDKNRIMQIRAHELMTAYAGATGAFVCVNDHTCMPTPEVAAEVTGAKNTCLFCIKYKENVEVKSCRDLSANPCREKHINAIRESYRFGGSYTYMCDLGFMFWTSPIYLDGQFAGALMGSGFLGISSEEACARMDAVCRGAVDKAELKQHISRFPRADGRKIKALAELMLVCAKSLSVGSEGCHAIMRRHAEQQAALSAKIEDLKSRYPSGRPEYPVAKEQELLKALRQGETELVRQILNELLAALFFANPDQFKHIQYRAMEMVILFSRMDTGPGFFAKSVFETNNHYIKSILETSTIEELTDALYQITDELAAQVISFQGIQHASALKKAERFIMENFTRKIGLAEIAKASGLSAPYFSTVFKEEMGENFSGYLNRLRAERAGYMLTGTNFSLSKIARFCGFEDQSWFSKIFKLYAGMSPGKYRSQRNKLISKIPETGFSDDYLMEMRA